MDLQRGGDGDKFSARIPAEHARQTMVTGRP
jgi:hypothetical protein